MIYKILRRLKLPLNFSPLLPIKDGILKGKYWLPSSTKAILEGNYEIENLEFLLEKKLENFNLFIDVGAHHGYYTHLINKLSPKAKIFCFEPDKNNFEVLRKLTKVNKIDCEIINKAVSDKVGHVSFSAGDNHVGNSYISDSPFIAELPKVTIPSTSLDAFFSEAPYKEMLNATNQVLLKIDVEGAELDTLKGAENLLKKGVTLILSTHDCHLPNVKKNCIDYLENLGYTVQFLSKYPTLEIEDFYCFKK